MAKRTKIGEVPPGRLGIYDHRLRYRGHCGPKATEATVARFGLTNGAALTTVKGKTAWVGKAPARPVGWSRA